jgi:hypothetical protein
MRALFLLLLPLLVLSGDAGATAPVGMWGVSDEGTSVRVSQDPPSAVKAKREHRLAILILLSALSARQSVN